MEKDDETTIAQSFHTDRKDPAVWLVKQPAMMGRARRRWFVLHRHSRILAYYSKSFIPPARAPLKGIIKLSEVTSVDCIGKRIEIGIAKGRVPFKLAADDEKTARDWSKFIKHEAHTMGIDNPLNRAVQEACGDKSKDAVEEMYSEYQDFKHAGEDAERGETGNYNDFTPNSNINSPTGPAHETSNYNDFTPNAAVRSPTNRQAQPQKKNSKGLARPERPRPPPPASKTEQPNYIDIPVSTTRNSGTFQSVGAVPQTQQSGVDESQNYLEIPVGGANNTSGAGPVDESQNYLEIPVGGSGTSEQKASSQNTAGVDESQNYLEIPVGGSGASENNASGDKIDESQNYLEIPVGGTQSKETETKEDDGGDSSLSSNSEDDS
eukprot:m.4791 g.4791  ORF g.4791 m.4791 type:complete len:379 (+) comp3103_c0_seq1:40-1176(+)